MEQLDDIIGRLTSMSPEDRRSVIEAASEETAKMSWVPNVGPQTEAYLSEADELFYGGQAGGGKTDLMVGLALTAHSRSLLLRRTNKEATGLVVRMTDILGTKEGYNGRTDSWKIPDTEDRIVDIGGCQMEDDKQKYKGQPHDLIGFDEVSDFTKTQYEFIIAWNRSAKPNQRCRVVAAGNPPTRPEGLWVVERWAPWLDPRHPNPAKPGELRWFVSDEETGRSIEVDGPGPHMVEGREIPVFARSRTFIPAQLSDNPDLARSNYAAVLDALPKELRDAYRDGKFKTVLEEGAFQTIPTEWVMAAIQRRRAKPSTRMSAIGADVAQGGKDESVLAPLYGGWFDELKRVPGKDTPNGAKMAGFIMSARRDGAIIGIDLGGGYGGAAYEWLKSNEARVKGFKGAEKATGKSKDGQLTFANMRSQAYWKLREALDPSQPGGSPIELPDDPRLIADLCAPTFEVGPQGIRVEPKESVVKRLGRSPDAGDAVVIAWHVNDKGIVNQVGYMDGSNDYGMGRSSRRPKVVMGYQSMRRLV